ncbi:hypothetical protein HYH03_005462 [Edaphochlamys debaryana]|uniref:MYND-type domain-containing protein n=1 Tax=Edaphochlamys debaryana TaxID=47281 RepID=A0A835Y7V4_9CHLO|nr:hypothetical protein HYH03_005462 [Edaphochlamys debaryana]|eukprot:KAG2496642.1 hypothetical protein HYH03_005462 [Edaphochlamys debaryana]
MVPPADGGVPPEARQALQCLVRLWERYVGGEQAPELGDELAAALAAFSQAVGTLAIEPLAVASPHEPLYLHASSSRGSSSLPQLAVEAGVVAGATAVLQAAAAQAQGNGSPLAARFTHAALAVLCRVASSAIVEIVDRPEEGGAGGSGDPLAGLVIMDQHGNTRPAVPADTGNPGRRGRQRRDPAAASTAATPASASDAAHLAQAMLLSRQLRQPALVEAVAAAVRALSAAADSGGSLAPSASAPSPSTVPALPLWRVLDRTAHLAHTLLWGACLDLKAPELGTARSYAYETKDPALARRRWPLTPAEVTQLLASLHSSGLLEALAAAMLGAPVPATLPGPAALGRRQQSGRGPGGPGAAAEELVGQAIANLSRALLFLPFVVKQITPPGKDSTRQPTPEGLRALGLLLGPAVQRLQVCLLERHCTDTAAAAAAAAAAGGGVAADEADASGGRSGGGGSSGWAALDSCRLPPHGEAGGRIDLSLPLPKPRRGSGVDRMPTSLTALRTWEVCAQLDLLGPPAPSGSCAAGGGGQEPRPPPLATVLECTRRVLRAGFGPEASLSHRQDVTKLLSWMLHLVLMQPAARPALRDEACALAALGATLEGMAAAVATAEYAHLHHPLALMDDERVEDVLHISEGAMYALLADADDHYVPGPRTPLRVLLLPAARDRVARVLAETRWAHTLEAAVRLTAGASPVMRMGPSGTRASFLHLTGPGGVTTSLLQSVGRAADFATLQAAVQQLGSAATPEAVAALLGSGSGGAGDDDGPPGQAERALHHTLVMALALPSPARALLPRAEPGPRGPPSAPSVTETLAQDLAGLLASAGKLARRLAAKAEDEVAAGKGLDRPVGHATSQLERLVAVVGHLLGAREMPKKKDDDSEPTAAATAEEGEGAEGSSAGGSALLAPPGPPALGLSWAAAAELRGAAALCLRSCIRASTGVLEAVAAKAAAGAAPASASRRQGGRAAAAAGAGPDPKLANLLTETIDLLDSSLGGWGSVSQGLVPAAPERLIKAACEALPAIGGTPAGPHRAGVRVATRRAGLFGTIVLSGLLDLAAHDALGAEAAAWLKPASPDGDGDGDGGSSSAAPAAAGGILERQCWERRSGWRGSGAAGHVIAWRLPRACCNPGCMCLDGPCEAELPLAQCGGCHAVRYCKVGDCQREAWRGGHKEVCAALAAERRRGEAEAAAAPAGAEE